MALEARKTDLTRVSVTVSGETAPAVDDGQNGRHDAARMSPRTGVCLAQSSTRLPYSPTEPELPYSPTELSGRAALSKRLARCVESALHHLGSQTPVISTGHGAIPAPPPADAARISARQTANNAQKCWCETRKADQMRRQTRVCLPPAATVLPLWPPAATAVQNWPTARQTAASVVRNRRHLPASPESP